MTQRGLNSAQTSRLQALQNKYSIINGKIHEAYRSPSTTDDHIKQLKKQRLNLEEEITGIRRASSS
jgi:hypothetical protein